MTLYDDLLKTLQSTHDRKQAIEEALQAAINQLRNAIVNHLGVPEDDCTLGEQAVVDGHLAYDFVIRLANGHADFGTISIPVAMRIIAGTCYIRLDDELPVKVEVENMTPQSFIPAAEKFGELLKEKALRKPE